MLSNISDQSVRVAVNDTETLASFCAETVPSDPDAATHQVYFLYCAGFIKIGVSKGLIRRLKDIQIGTPFPSQAVMLIRGGRITEQYMHFLYNEYHHRGEWFVLGPRLRAMIVAQAPPECLEWLAEEEAVHRAWIKEQAAALG